jgi:hypothetical protein
MIKKIAFVTMLTLLFTSTSAEAATMAVDLYDIKKLYIKVKPKKIRNVSVIKSENEPIKNTEQKISINNIVVDKVKKNARDSVISYNSNLNYNINYIIDENISKENVSFIKNQINKTLSTFSTIYEDKPFTIFLWTEKNLEWANKVHNELYDNNLPTHAKKLFNCDSASANIYNNKTFIIMCIQDDFPNGFGRGASLPHELAHIVQYQQEYIMYPNVPCWIIEGSASFYGESIGLSELGSKQLREHFARQKFNDVSTMHMIRNNPEELVRAIEDRTCGFFNNRSYVESGYLVGSIFTEILVGIYGNQKMIDFYKSFDVSSDWKSNFYKVFQISVDDFYKKSIPVLENMI